MMIALDDKHLMMIEPENFVKDVVLDSYTAAATYVLATAVTGNRYRGWHRCKCGRNSDNVDWILPTGHITNSLLVHYVQDHRDEVPQSELDKLSEILQFIEEMDDE
jgi:hypothetical protein